MDAPATDRIAANDRIAVERDFHNARYGSGEDTRAHLDVYYVAISDGERDFDRIVTERSAGKTVLEYGCADGAGVVSRLPTPRVAAAYHGIDIADAAIEVARRRAAAAGYRNCTFHAMNAEAMTFADASFDLIYGHGILHHLDLEKCFAELYRTLKPGGAAVFMEPLGHNILLNWYRARTPDLRTPDEHPLVAGDLRLAARHFDAVETRFTGLTTLLALPLRRTKLARPALAAAIAVDRVLLRFRPLGLQAWYVLMVMRKSP
jgi:SAM-dependent methyltransferase